MPSFGGAARHELVQVDGVFRPIRLPGLSRLETLRVGTGGQKQRGHERGKEQNRRSPETMDEHRTRTGREQVAGGMLRNGTKPTVLLRSLRAGDVTGAAFSQRAISNTLSRVLHNLFRNLQRKAESSLRS